MKAELFDALLAYKAAMSQAKIMCATGLITGAEYSAIEAKLCEKYGIKSCSLFRDNDWINTPGRGNMSPTEEVIKCQEQ